MEALQSIISGKISTDSLRLLCDQSDSKGKYYTQLKKTLLFMKNIPVMHLLAYESEKESSSSSSETEGIKNFHLPPKKPIEELFTEMKDDTIKSTVNLLYAILSAQVKSTFHKINVHAAMTPSEVWLHFEPAFNQANELQEKYLQMKPDSSSTTEDMPLVTVRVHYAYSRNEFV